MDICNVGARARGRGVCSTRDCLVVDRQFAERCPMATSAAAMVITSAAAVVMPWGGVQRGRGKQGTRGRRQCAARVALIVPCVGAALIAGRRGRVWRTLRSR